MRSLVAVAATLILSASASTGAIGAPGTDAVKPESVIFAKRGVAALERGQAATAIDQFEAALALDPGNGEAFIGMARAAQSQGMPGKAVKFYREALSLDPNDLTALEGQGTALVQRGSVARAKVNLVRLQELCGQDCPNAKRLATAIEAGPPKPTRTADRAAEPPTARN